ncbi:hypothetical protein ACOZ4B_14435 [Haloferax prahovense]|uniref:hypothetical protein n=1 Tax=Haloferax prahovense TaxID=381852 RepID=UPI003C742D43
MADSTLSELGSKWFADILAAVTGWFQRGITDGYEQLSAAAFGTPTPETGSVLGIGVPTNEPWQSLHETLVAGETTFLALLLLVMAVQARNTIRVFNLGNPLIARATSRSAWTGGVLIVCWYWIAAASLTLVDAVTLLLLPPVTSVGTLLSDLLVVTITNPILAFGLGALGALGMWGLQALFVVRDLLLFGYLFAMPFGLAVTYANLPVVSRLTASLCRRFISLLIVPLPIALLFGAYDLVLAPLVTFDLVPGSAFARYLLATSLPLVSVYIAWRLFRDVIPRTTRAVQRTGRLTATAGTVVAAGAVSGPAGAASVAKLGARSAAVNAVETTLEPSAPPETATQHDHVAADANGQRGVPTYRRTENDPGYY